MFCFLFWFSHITLPRSHKLRYIMPYLYRYLYCFSLIGSTTKTQLKTTLSSRHHELQSTCICVIIMYLCIHSQSFSTIWDPTDCRPQGSSVHGISQGRILEWVVISVSRGSSRPRDWSCISFCTGRWILYHCATWEVQWSVQFSCSVVSDSLQPNESQHARSPCPLPTPGVHSDSHPLSQWCHPAISSSVVPFSSCPQSLPASESFPMSQLFALGGQSTGVSALASFLPKKSQGWSPSEWTGWVSLQSKGLSRLFSNTTVQKHQFFGSQPSSQSNSHIHIWPQEKP